MSSKLRMIALAVLGRISPKDLSCEMLFEVICQSTEGMRAQFVAEFIHRPECDAQMMFELYKQVGIFDKDVFNEVIDQVFLEKLIACPMTQIKAWFTNRCSHAQTLLQKALFLHDEIDQRRWKLLIKDVELTEDEINRYQCKISSMLNKIATKTLRRMINEVKCNALRDLICRKYISRGAPVEALLSGRYGLPLAFVLFLAGQNREKAELVSLPVLYALYDKIFFSNPNFVSEDEIKNNEWIIQELVRRMLKRSLKKVETNREELWLIYAETLLKEVLAGTRIVTLDETCYILAFTRAYVNDVFDSLGWQVKIGWSKYLLTRSDVTFNRVCREISYLALDYPEVHALIIKKCTEELTFEKMLERFKDYPLVSLKRYAGMDTHAILKQLRTLSIRCLLKHWSKNTSFHQAGLKKLIEQVLQERELELMATTDA